MQLPFDTIISDFSASALDRDKTRIYQAICDQDEVSRKRLAKHLSMRPTTISTLVNELIKDEVVEEVRTVASSGQGRPEVVLAPVRDRFIVIMLQVVSRTIRCRLVDMSGSLLGEEIIEINRDEADNSMILAATESLIEKLIANTPERSEILGIGIVVPGIIDRQNRLWIYSARWPRMQALPFDEIGEKFGLPVGVNRNLNLELRTRLLRKKEEREGSVLLIHWGYGIGSSYALNGSVIESSIGSFGEFGHWTVDPSSMRQCHCGESGCLETIASLWSLLPELRTIYPVVPSEETAFEAFTRENDISELPMIERAVDAFALSLANLNKAVFADRIVLTGPFVNIPSVLKRLESRFFQHLPHYAHGKCQMYVATLGAFDITQGCVMPFFEERMRTIFTAHDEAR
ncbi:ROK family protein [Thalassospira sp.]|uniref:ROK family transcriptional regulator n=1 Tax=Thalassospira sp. TaxID=1912094 RepID=UPI003AA914B5